MGLSVCSLVFVTVGSECVTTCMCLVSSTISAACPPAGLYGTVIMRCKQTACPVPPADILIFLLEAKRNLREKKYIRYKGEGGKGKGAEGKGKARSQLTRTEAKWE